MRRCLRHRSLPHAVRSRRAFSLIEAAMATAIVAIMIGGGLGAIAQAGKNRSAAEQQALARNLADMLLQEAAGKLYEEPGVLNSPIKLEDNELIDDRTTLDDCDDYHGIVIRPVSTEKGTVLCGGRWEATFQVEWINLTSPLVARNADTGIKRIGIVLRYNGVEAQRASVVKSRGWEQLQ